MSFLSSLFGEKKDPAVLASQEVEKKFEILKYDGIRAFSMGKTAYAIKCLEEAAALKEDVETLINLSNMQAQVEDYPAALATLERITTINPQDASPLIAMANLLFITEDYQQMSAICQQAMSLSQDNALLYLLSAKAYTGLNNEIMAIAMLTQAISLKGDYTDALLMRADLLMRMGQLTDAQADIILMLEQDPENEQALIMKAQLLAPTQPADAIVCLEQVINQNPFHEQAYIMLAQLQQGQGNLQQAIETLTTAIEANENAAAAYQLRGKYRLEQGDKEGSFADLKKVMELSPEAAKEITGAFNNQ